MPMQEPQNQPDFTITGPAAARKRSPRPNNNHNNTNNNNPKQTNSNKGIRQVTQGEDHQGEILQATDRQVITQEEAHLQEVTYAQSAAIGLVSAVGFVGIRGGNVSVIALPAEIYVGTATAG